MDNTMRVNAKRTSYITWDEYFISMILLEIDHNSETATQAALVVNHNNQVISFNVNVKNSNLHENHAEYRTINEIETGNTLYVSSLSCVACARLIVEKKLQEVVYLRDSEYQDEVDLIFKGANIKYRLFERNRDEIKLL